MFSQHDGIGDTVDGSRKNKKNAIFTDAQDTRGSPHSLIFTVRVGIKIVSCMKASSLVSSMFSHIDRCFYTSIQNWHTYNNLISVLA